MKSLICVFILEIVFVSCQLHATVVTMTARGTNNQIGVSELSIGSYETAELISYPPHPSADANGIISVIKDGITFTFDNSFHPRPSPTKDPLIIAGPATIRLTSTSLPAYPAICTFRVTPEPFPPDRTVIALPGTNQTTVTLECSTNLVDWAVATNGVYGPMPQAKFFRIKLATPAP